MDVLDILWARSLRRPLSFAGPTQPYNIIHTQNSFDHKVNGVSGAEASDYLSDLPDVMVLFVRPPRCDGVICPPSQTCWCYLSALPDVLVLFVHPQLYISVFCFSTDMLLSMDILTGMKNTCILRLSDDQCFSVHVVFGRMSVLAFS